MYKLILYYFFILITLYGCVAGKSSLTSQQLTWLDPYTEGDTLIFRSENGELDTSYVIKIDLHYGEANIIETGRYRHQWGQVKYKNSKLQYHQQYGDDMISMVTSDPPEETRFSISYLYSGIMPIKFSELSKFKKGDIYEFDTYHPKAKPYQPKKIIWHPQKGILKYISHDNITWQRINLH